MNWIVSNWYLIFAGLVCLAFVVTIIVKYFRLPTAKQVANIKEWLKWAVTEAEKSLGGGTGQLKLRMVYNMAAEKFPWIVNYVSFAVFSGWVDIALEWMRDQLNYNADVEAYVSEG